MKFSWIATKRNSSPTEENILAPNQKVPSAREPCVSSLAISRYLPHLCDQDMAAAQRLAPKDGRGQKQWAQRDAISAWRALWCEPRRPSIYNSSRPLWKNQLLCPFGGTPCKNGLLRKIMPIFYSNNALNLTIPSMYSTVHVCGKCWMYTMKPVAASARCLWNGAAGCLPLSLPVLLLSGCNEDFAYENKMHLLHKKILSSSSSADMNYPAPKRTSYLPQSGDIAAHGSVRARSKWR